MTLTATPFPPNSFYNWTGDLIARTNPAGLTMNSNKTVRANFTCAPATAGLVAWWRGENDASDFIGGHAGTFYSGNNVVAPSITVTGMVGGAFVHFGTNHIRVPDASDLRPAQITQEAWVFGTVQSGSYQTVIARGSGSNDDDTYYLATLWKLWA